MKEIERLSPKETFLQEMEEAISKSMPEQWDDETRKKTMERTSANKIKSAAFTAIPMICNGSKCPFKNTCEFFKDGIAPLGLSCHPPGVLIKTIEHGDVAIENLDPNIHRLFGWERKNNAIRKGGVSKQGFRFSLHSRHYCNSMYAFILANKKGYECTYDHVVVTRFNEQALDKFCVYIMRKGEHWRIGQTRIAAETKKSKHNHKTSLRFNVRGHAEKADEMWIIDVYDTLTESLIAEEYYSIKFGISKMSFVDSLLKKESKYDGLYKWATRKQIEEHHNSVKKSREYYAEVLLSIGRSIDYPIWKRNGFSESEPELGPYVKYPMFMRACNVIPEIMDMPVFNSTKTSSKHTLTSEWQVVSDIAIESYCNIVYSLDVEGHKTYFANDIATHNCPYELAMVRTFMADYIEQLEIDPNNWVELSQVRDLVDQEVQMVRKAKYLAKEDFIQENVVGVDSDGDPVFKKELHMAVELEDRLHKRRNQMFKQVLATRESKVKAGAMQADTAQNLSNLMKEYGKYTREEDERLKRELGIVDVDEYVEQDRANQEEGD